MNLKNFNILKKDFTKTILKKKKKSIFLKLKTDP
jgi:hypothetical protein